MYSAGVWKFFWGSDQKNPLWCFLKRFVVSNFWSMGGGCCKFFEGEGVDPLLAHLMSCGLVELNKPHLPLSCTEICTCLIHSPLFLKASANQNAVQSFKEELLIEKNVFNRCVMIIYNIIAIRYLKRKI